MKNKKVKFVQFQVNDSLREIIYALDDKGCIWVRKTGPTGLVFKNSWEKINNPEAEV